MITINKLDRAFLELQLPSDDMYTAFVKHVENVNVLVSTYHDEALGDVQVDPTKGTVAFSAGSRGTPASRAGSAPSVGWRTLDVVCSRTMLARELGRMDMRKGRASQK